MKRDAQINKNQLSEDIFNRLEEVLKEYKSMAEQLGAVRFFGIATAVFRTTQNGAELCTRLGRVASIELEVVSQNEEARLGHLTAVALTGDANVVSFDCGGGSFQLGNFQGDWGSVSVWLELIRTVQNRPESIMSPNPVSLSDVSKLIANIQSHLPAFDKPDYSTARIICIGGETSVFNMVRLALDGATQFRGVEIRRVLEEKLVGKSDEELLEISADFTQISLLVGKITLVVTALEYLNLENVQLEYHACPGSCPGIILSRATAADGLQDVMKF